MAGGISKIYGGKVEKNPNLPNEKIARLAFDLESLINNSDKYDDFVVGFDGLNKIKDDEEKKERYENNKWRASYFAKVLLLCEKIMELIHLNNGEVKDFKKRYWDIFYAVNEIKRSMSAIIAKNKAENKTEEQIKESIRDFSVKDIEMENGDGIKINTSYEKEIDNVDRLAMDIVEFCRKSGYLEEEQKELKIASN